MKPSEYIRQGWSQYAHARNAKGRKVWPEAPTAVAWDPIGAIYAAYAKDETKMRTVKKKFMLQVGMDKIQDWNDAPERTKEEVIAAFEAIGE